MQVGRGRNPLEQRALAARMSALGIKARPDGVIPKTPDQAKRVRGHHQAVVLAAGADTKLSLDEVWTLKPTVLGRFFMKTASPAEAAQAALKVELELKGLTGNLRSFLDKLGEGAGDGPSLAAELSRHFERFERVGADLKRLLSPSILAAAKPERLRALTTAYHGFIDAYATANDAVAQLVQGGALASGQIVRALRAGATPEAELATKHQTQAWAKLHPSLAGVHRTMSALLLEFALFETGQTHVITKQAPRPLDELALAVAEKAVGGRAPEQMPLSQLEQIAKDKGVPLKDVLSARALVVTQGDVVSRLRIWCEESGMPGTRLFFTLSDAERAAKDIGAAPVNVLRALDVLDGIALSNATWSAP